MRVAKKTEMIPVSEARSCFGKLLKRAEYKGDRIVVSVHGEPVAAIVPYDDLQSLERFEGQALGKQALAAINDTDDDVIAFDDISPA